MAKTRRAYTGGAVSTTTTSAINASGTTSFTITAYTGWPYGSDPFYIVVEPGTASEEKILVTRTGATDTTINIASDSVRGLDGTAAVSHGSGVTTFPVFTAVDADEANELASKWSAKGDLVSYGSSTFEKLGVGADDTVLVADSGEASGLKWSSALDLSALTVSGDVTVDTDTLHVDTTNNRVGIGTSTPDQKLEIYGSVDTEFVRFSAPFTTTGQQAYVTAVDSDDSGIVAAIGLGTSASGSNDNDGQISFYTTTSATGTIPATAAMTINHNGYVGLFGQTSPAFPLDVGGGGGIAYDANIATYSSSGRRAISVATTSTNTRYALSMTNPNGNVGNIYTTGSSTVYATSSDYRLKENLSAINDALGKLNSLPVYEFNFIADPDTRVTGFLAHELAEVIPEAVDGEKDAVNENGEIIPQGVDQSKVVPLLVAAVQQLSSTVAALEARVVALEAK